jgi:hypothetical protein
MAEVSLLDFFFIACIASLNYFYLVRTSLGNGRKLPAQPDVLEVPFATLSQAIRAQAN